MHDACCLCTVMCSVWLKLGCFCAAVSANQKLARHEIIGKMIERAQQLDSLAADEIKSVLGHQLQPPLHGKPMHCKPG